MFKDLLATCCADDNKLLATLPLPVASGGREKKNCCYFTASSTLYKLQVWARSGPRWSELVLLTIIKTLLSGVHCTNVWRPFSTPHFSLSRRLPAFPFPSNVGHSTFDSGPTDQLYTFLTTKALIWMWVTSTCSNHSRIADALFCFWRTRQQAGRQQQK